VLFLGSGGGPSALVFFFFFFSLEQIYLHSLTRPTKYQDFIIQISTQELEPSPVEREGD